MQQHLLTISILLITNVLCAQNILSGNPKLDSVWQSINKLEKEFKDSSNLEYNSRMSWRGRKVIIKGNNAKNKRIFYEKSTYYKDGKVYRKIYLTVGITTISDTRSPHISWKTSIKSVIFSLDNSIIYARIFDKKQNRVINIRNNKLYANQKYTNF